MAWSPNVSPQRRDTIRHAACAVVRLAHRPELHDQVHKHHAIVADYLTYTDQDAATALTALHALLTTRQPLSR